MLDAHLLPNMEAAQSEGEPENIIFPTFRYLLSSLLFPSPGGKTNIVPFFFNFIIPFSWTSFWVIYVW